MDKRILAIYRFFTAFGMDPLMAIKAFEGLPAFYRDLFELKHQQKGQATLFPVDALYPCLTDRHEESGSLSKHYFYQDLWVAQKIFKNNPKLHVDVGSRVDGFVAHVASYRPIQVMDIRPLSNRIPNVEFIQADVMANIHPDLIEYCDSLSCLHALEHFGLGRYGDPVKYNGHLLGLNNLCQILRKHGKLYLSVPIGPQRIEFNAHRVFSIYYLLDLLTEKFSLDGFSFVDDSGNFHTDVEMDDANIKANFICNYGCGIFELTKL
jgi:hypothetical protein